MKTVLEAYTQLDTLSFEPRTAILSLSVEREGKVFRKESRSQDSFHGPNPGTAAHLANACVLLTERVPLVKLLYTEHIDGIIYHCEHNPISPAKGVIFKDRMLHCYQVNVACERWHNGAMLSASAFGHAAYRLAQTIHPFSIAEFDKRFLRNPMDGFAKLFSVLCSDQDPEIVELHLSRLEEKEGNLALEKQKRFRDIAEQLLNSGS